MVANRLRLGGEGGREVVASSQNPQTAVNPELTDYMVSGSLRKPIQCCWQERAPGQPPHLSTRAVTMVGSPEVEVMEVLEVPQVVRYRA